MPGHAINVLHTGVNPSTKTELPYVARNMVFRSDGRPVWEPYTYNHVHDFWNIDPRLVDPARGDYHLKPDSPAIGAGVEVSGVTVDAEGYSRPAKGACSIGAFEYHRK